MDRRPKKHRRMSPLAPKKSIQEAMREVVKYMKNLKKKEAQEEERLRQEEEDSIIGEIEI